MFHYLFESADERKIEKEAGPSDRRGRTARCGENSRPLGASHRARGLSWRIARLHVARETIVTLICKYPAPQGVLERVPAPHTPPPHIYIYIYIHPYTHSHREPHKRIGSGVARDPGQERSASARCAFASSNMPQWSCRDYYEGKSGEEGALPLPQPRNQGTSNIAVISILRASILARPGERLSDVEHFAFRCRLAAKKGRKSAPIAGAGDRLECGITDDSSRVISSRRHLDIM